MDIKPLIEKEFKRLTLQDTKHVFSKRVLVYAMTRKTHQGTEQAYWQWGILPGEGMSLSKYQNYPIRVLHRIARSGFWFEKCLIYACLIEKITFFIYEYYKQMSLLTFIIYKFKINRQNECYKKMSI
jgi:hypothetical protein